MATNVHDRTNQEELVNPTNHSMTVFLCDYLVSREVQREVHEGLNVVENWNATNDFKRRLGARFYQETARAKMENGNSAANVLGLLGLIAASFVLPQETAQLRKIKRILPIALTLIPR